MSMTKPQLLVRRLSSLAACHGRSRSRPFPSSAAAAATASIAVEEESAVVIPRMPSFNYVPPPYDGPRAAEILKKRSEFLSPSMFYFYKKPVIFFFKKIICSIHSFASSFRYNLSTKKFVRLFIRS